METPQIIAVVAIVLVVVVGALLLYRAQQSKRLRQRFGPEYERALDRSDDRRTAERDLALRERRREKLDIKPLSPDMRERYADEWRVTQAQFVDEPAAAVRDAHRLIVAVMRDRGYPVEDFEVQADTVSVDHPEVVEDYRYAHQVSRDAETGDATTEDLREAMVRYRSLFGRLLETRTTAGRGRP